MMSDLNILAVQYALGELSGVDAASFEQRLETEQAAREALADAVLLMSAVRELPQEVVKAPVPVPRTSQRSRIAVLTACVAAVLTVVVLMKWPGGDGVARRGSGEAPALVEAWSELGRDDVVLAEADGDAAGDDSASEIPDWVVAAVLDEVEIAPRGEGTL